MVTARAPMSLRVESMNKLSELDAQGGVTSGAVLHIVLGWIEDELELNELRNLEENTLRESRTQRPARRHR